MALTVTHSRVTGAAANPAVLVDGPAWDAVHTISGGTPADVGLGNVSNVDNTNASNLTSGTLPSGRLPAPTSSALGGVQSAVAVTHNWINSISTSGVPSLSQPAFTDLSGSIAVAQINSGTGATSSTFLRGDGTWASPAGTSGALLASNNLSDVANAPASIRNLGGIDLSATVSIITTTTLTTSAFGKLHLLSGTSTYTVTLPTPVGYTGAVIALSVDNETNATKMYAIASPSGNVGRASSLGMWAREQLVIRSDGTNWIILSAKQIPLVGQLTTSTSQTSNSSGVEVQFTSAGADQTSLNICYDSTNKRFVAPRTTSFLLNPYVYQTAIGSTFNQAFISSAIGTVLSGILSYTGSVNAGTVYGTSRQLMVKNDLGRVIARTDGTSPSIAAATVTCFLDYAEVVPSW